MFEFVLLCDFIYVRLKIWWICEQFLCQPMVICICEIFYAFDKLTLLQYICVLDYVSYYVMLCVNLFA